jgi:hypothetical protein
MTKIVEKPGIQKALDDLPHRIQDKYETQKSGSRETDKIRVYTQKSCKD